MDTLWVVTSANRCQGVPRGANLGATRAKCAPKAPQGAAPATCVAVWGVGSRGPHARLAAPAVAGDQVGAKPMKNLAMWAAHGCLATTTARQAKVRDCVCARAAYHLERNETPREAL